MVVRRVVALAAVLAVSLGVAGCSDSEAGPGTEPSRTPTVPSPSPTETGPVEPEPPAAMETVDEAGAAAFAEYYFALINYAQQSYDLRSLTKVSMPRCEPCQGGVEWLEQAAAKEWTVHGGEYSVVRPTAVRLTTGDEPRFRIEASLKSTLQEIANSRGKVLSKYPATTVRISLIASFNPDVGWRVGYWEYS